VPGGEEKGKNSGAKGEEKEKLCLQFAARKKDFQAGS